MTVNKTWFKEFAISAKKNNKQRCRLLHVISLRGYWKLKMIGGSSERSQATTVKRIRI